MTMDIRAGSWPQSILLLGLCLAVSGCGGAGDHVGRASGPTAPTSSPQSFAGLNQNITVQTSSTAVSYSFDTINGVSSIISRSAPGTYGDDSITITYDAASQTYTVRDAANAIAYAPADKATPTTDLTTSPFDTYVRQNGKITDTVKAYRVGGLSAQFPQLTYTTFVVAQRSTVTNTSGISQQFSQERLIYAVGGFETVRSDLPKAGTASYLTFATGTAINKGSPRNIGGSATIVADFGAASVNTSLALTANGQPIGTFNGTAPIESATSRFKGNLDAGGATQGSFAGSFFGPQATEVGYTYRVQTSIGTVDGGAVGKK